MIRLPAISRFRKRRGSESAFSMIEVLASTALLAVITVAICTVINTASSISTQTTARLNATNAARDCLDLIGRDLMGAKIPVNRLAANSYQMLINPVLPKTIWANPHSIFWQIPARQAAAEGDVASVGYFALAQPSSKRFQLRRVYVEPTSQAVSSKLYPDLSQTSVDWVTSELLDKFGPDQAANDDQTGWLADGILGLWVRALDKEGEPIVADGAGATTANNGYSFDSRKGFRSATYRTPDPASYSMDGKEPPTGSTPAYNALPSYVEIALICVAPQDIERIQNLPPANPSNPNSFETDISAYLSAVRSSNKALKSLSLFSRKFQIPNSD